VLKLPLPFVAQVPPPAAIHAKARSAKPDWGHSSHSMPKQYLLFDERKAAQAAAFLLHKAGGQLPLLKLMKLLYLTERLSLQRYGDTVTGDRFVSMPHGPVLSMTLDLMNGASLSSAGGDWDTWVADRANYALALRDPGMIRSPEEDLLALSDTDLECLGEVWGQFGGWEAFALRDYTHSDACPEWQDPHGSSHDIPTARLLRVLGHTSEQVEALTKRLHAQRYINASLS
jgi:uncharacterized phage-associated protein